MILNNAKQTAAVYKKLEQSRKYIVHITPFSYYSRKGSLQQELDDVQTLLDAKEYEIAVSIDNFIMFCLFPQSWENKVYCIRSKVCISISTVKLKTVSCQC